MLDRQRMEGIAEEVLARASHIVVSRETRAEFDRIVGRLRAGLPVSEDELSRLDYALNCSLPDGDCIKVPA